MTIIWEKSGNDTWLGTDANGDRYMIQKVSKTVYWSYAWIPEISDWWKCGKSHRSLKRSKLACITPQQNPRSEGLSRKELYSLTYYLSDYSLGTFEDNLQELLESRDVDDFSIHRIMRIAFEHQANLKDIMNSAYSSEICLSKAEDYVNNLLEREKRKNPKRRPNPTSSAALLAGLFGYWIGKK